MRRLLRQINMRIIGIVIAVFTPFEVAAQSISLLADTVYLNQSSGILVASGNVQIFFEGRVLTATEITYDSNTESITAQGPLTITDSDGTVMQADFAQLSQDLQNGLVRGAKILFSDQLQLAATEAIRTDGRFNTMSNVVASTCQVCISRPVPIWQIRAQQVIHDQEKQQIHFRNATLEVMGVPTIFLPYMRIPDPSVKRATGFLAPVFLSSEYFGGGLKLPYYILLGDYSDATITSTASLSGVFVLDGQYRQRFVNGGFDAYAAIAVQDEYGEFGRGFLKADGSFIAFDNVTLSFDITIPSDDGFMNQYGYDDTDRLVSEISASRYRNRSYFSLASAIMTSLRDDEIDAEIPIVLPELSYRGYETDPLFGGKVGYEINAVGLIRRQGQDVLRFGGGVDWYLPINLPIGIRAAGFAAADIDFYRVWDSLSFPNRILINAYPSVGAELRWPLSMTTQSARHVIEPVVQVVYTANPGFNDLVPNEDSLQIEFDETNLFDLNRFPGRDVSETGLRANLGATYTLYSNDGWSLGLAGGVVLRSTPSAQFPPGSLFGGSQSDILGAVSFDYAPNFNVVGRFLFDDKFDFKRSETQFTLNYDTWDISSSLLYLAPDILALSSEERSEGSIEGRYRFADNWQVNAEWQRDLLNGRDVYAEVGLTYGNECIEIGLSLSRNFTTSTTVTPSTDVNLNILLAGFGGTAQHDWPAARCIK